MLAILKTLWVEISTYEARISSSVVDIDVESMKFLLILFLRIKMPRYDNDNEPIYDELKDFRCNYHGVLT